MKSLDSLSDLSILKTVHFPDLKVVSYFNTQVNNNSTHEEVTGVIRSNNSTANNETL